MRHSLPEPHRSPVGLHDLPHQLEARAVGGAAVGLQLAGGINRCQSSHRRAALHEQDDFSALGPGPQADGAASW